MIHGKLEHMNCWASLRQEELPTLNSTSNTHTGTFDDAGGTTLTDAAAAFPTSGVGLVGWTVIITSGTGQWEWRLITANTATTLTVASLTTDATSNYTVFPDLSVQTTVKKYTAAAKLDFLPGNGMGWRAHTFINTAAGTLNAAHGRWIYVNAAPTATTACTIFGLNDDGILGVGVGIGNDRKLTIISSDDATVHQIRATGSLALTLDTWYWVAIQGRPTIPAVAAYADADVRVYNTSGTLVDSFSATGFYAAGYFFNEAFIGSRTLSAGAGMVVYLDGGIAVSGSGVWPPICPDFWSAAPTGVGATSQWTSSAGGDKWLDVDETPHTSDTDYIYSTSTGQTQLFTFPASGIGTVNIRAVGIGHYLRAVSASILTVHGMTLGSSYTAVPALTTTYSSSSHGMYDMQKATTPAGGEWTTANLDDVVSRVATFGAVATERRCTNVVKFACYGGTYPSRRRRRGVVV